MFLILSGFIFASLETIRLNVPLFEGDGNDSNTSISSDTIPEETTSTPDNISITSLDKGPVATTIPRNDTVPTTVTTEEYLSNKDGYAILHYKESNSYSIILLREPLDTYQKQAEEELIKLLNIPPYIACDRNIEVKVPRFVTKNTAEYRSLSFCNN